MTVLDTAVARAVHLARLLESLVHDGGPWSVAYGGQVFPAVRTVHDDHVSVSFDVPAQCWIERPDGLGVLVRDGSPVYVRDLGFHGDGPVSISWDFWPDVVPVA